jgi:hypothetical protein
VTRTRQEADGDTIDTPRERYYADWVMKNGLTKVASN